MGTIGSFRSVCLPLTETGCYNTFASKNVNKLYQEEPIFTLCRRVGGPGVDCLLITDGLLPASPSWE
jgi:hypothetical protein